jgi:hypothetical protein
MKDTTYPNEGGGEDLLRLDDLLSTLESQDNAGDGAAGPEPRAPRPRRRLSTLACIILPTVLALLAAFVAAALLPPAPAHAPLPLRGRSVVGEVSVDTTNLTDVTPVLKPAVLPVMRPTMHIEPFPSLVQPSADGKRTENGTLTVSVEE